MHSKMLKNFKANHGEQNRMPYKSQSRPYLDFYDSVENPTSVVFDQQLILSSPTVNRATLLLIW